VGSCNYVVAVLKAVVDVCDGARAEVSERLLGELLVLRSDAGARRAREEAATLSEAAAQSNDGDGDSDGGGTAESRPEAQVATTSLLTRRPRYAQEEGPEALAQAFLPCPQEAQRMACVRQRGAVTRAEIEALLLALPTMQDGGLAVQKRRGLTTTRSSVDDSTAYRDPTAWTTTYVHAEHRFQTAFPALFERLRRLALDTDAAHWGIVAKAGAAQAQQVQARCVRSLARCRRWSLPFSACCSCLCPCSLAAARWDLIFLSVALSVGLPVRVIEVHEAGAGAGLAYDQHYDSGSIVTLDVLLSDPSEFEGGHFQM
jgi:hypothetical protein